MVLVEGLLPNMVHRVPIKEDLEVLVLVGAGQVKTMISLEDLWDLLLLNMALQELRDSQIVYKNNRDQILNIELRTKAAPEI